ncbi:MAG: hypothetical protein IJ247_00790 [Bacilli bacterium]|nr:hypothetical protein [Bacilli bacterium]
MKRNILLAILPLTLLSSCGTNNYDATFKEYELNNAEVLRDEELDNFKTKVLKEAEKINRIERHTTTAGTYTMSQNESKTDRIYNFYTNMTSFRTIEKSRSSSNGITFNRESDETTESWNLNADIYKGILVHSYDAIKGEHEYKTGSESSYVAPTASELIKSSVFYYTQTIYKTSNCYYSINSYKSRKVSYISFGNETKERVSEYNRQECYEISLNFRITNGHIFSNSISSVDPETEEWYGSPKEISKTTGNVYYEYNGQKHADTTKIIEDYKAYSPVK